MVTGARDRSDRSKWFKRPRARTQIEPPEVEYYSTGRRALLAGTAASAGFAAASLASSLNAAADDGNDIGRVPSAERISGGGVTELGSDAELPLERVALASVVGRTAFVGESNQTSYLQEMLDRAAETNDVVNLRPGTYVCEGLKLPAKTTLRAVAGDGARFGAAPPELHEYGGVQLRRPAGSSNAEPVVHLVGSGASLKGVTIDGADTPGTGLRTEGFEANVVGVRVIRVAGVGFEVVKANNGVMRDIWIDNCGAQAQPAVVISAVRGTGSAGETNNQEFHNLHIERPQGTALRIGGRGVGYTAVQWLRFYGLHVEAPSHGADSSSGRPALIQIWNVQGIEIIAPMIYGGPGVLLEHDQDVLEGPDAGGVRISGGVLLGQGKGLPTPTLICLSRGDAFWLNGTALSRYSGPAVTVGQEYGPQVHLAPSRTEQSVPFQQDQRASAAPTSVRGNRLFHGHISSGGDEPKVAHRV